MNLHSLVAALPRKTGAIYTLERGKPVQHPYTKLAGEVADAKASLSAWGVKAGTRVGIYAPNSRYWLIYDLALIELGAVSVPFTDDFSGQVNADLLARYDIALLLTAKAHARLFTAGTPGVAFMDADNGAVSVIDRPVAIPDDPDHLSLAFSSGSAGGLKGLVISREGVESTLPPIINAIGLTSQDRLLLFMPMSNFQQRNMCYAALECDFDVIITDYAQLFVAINLLRPTVLIAPPMYFQMVHTRFLNLPAWKRTLWTVLGSLISLVPGQAVRRALARRAFPEFYKQFGSSMRLLITGMAPIKRSIGAFFNLMQLPFAESYGMVESGSLTYRPPGCKKYGSVGKPLDGIDIRFESDGEIIVRRERSLTKKYFQCAEGESERTFIADGCVATGDIGKLDADGDLYLLGRKKELIVSPSGYKIHPEIIEEELNSCPDVAQCVVFARPGATQLVCVVVPGQFGSDEARDRIRKFAGALTSTKKTMPVGEVLFAEVPFSIENGMLRPNLKVDRRGIAANFAI